MSAELDIYDFEGVLSNAIQLVLDGVDITNLTIQDDQELQKDRPRCEVGISISDSNGEMFPEAGQPAVPGYLRELTFSGQCSVSAITDADIAIHATYRSRIRNVCATMCRRVNGDPELPKHKLQMFKSAGASYQYEADQGYYMTTLLYDFSFSIQYDALNSALAELNGTT